MTIIKFLVLIIACIAIEPCLFVASFFTMFSTAVSSDESNLEWQIFLQNTESIKIIIRKQIWQIRRGVQSTNRISEETDISDGIRSGVYRAHLCGRGLSSMVMGGRYKYGLPNSYVNGLSKKS